MLINGKTSPRALRSRANKKNADLMSAFQTPSISLNEIDEDNHSDAPNAGLNNTQEHRIIVQDGKFGENQELL